MIDEKKLVERINEINRDAHSEEESKDLLDKLIHEIQSGEFEPEPCEAKEADYYDERKGSVYICTGCGAESIEKQNYCFNCGRKLGESK